MLKRRIAAMAFGLAGCTAGAAMAQAGAIRIDPAWLQADSATSTAEFALLGGLGGSNGGMNFNGTSGGALVLSVPVGWHVVLHFRNVDQNMPHSAEVIRTVTPLPMGVVAPAFDHAATRRLAQGLPTDAREDVRFVADRAGGYIIFCAVPGHGAAGMWMRLEVSATASRPAVAAAGQGAP